MGGTWGGWDWRKRELECRDRVRKGGAGLGHGGKRLGSRGRVQNVGDTDRKQAEGEEGKCRFNVLVCLTVYISLSMSKIITHRLQNYYQITYLEYPVNTDTSINFFTILVC